MKQELSKEELYALARLLKVDVVTLTRLRNHLDTKKIRKEIIEHEYNHLVKERIFKKAQIIGALIKKYGVSKSYIELIIYAKKANKGRACVRCSKLITAYKWGRNNGVCDSCITKAIKNYDLYEAEQPDCNNQTAVDCTNEKPSGE